LRPGADTVGSGEHVRDHRAHRPVLALKVGFLEPEVTRLAGISAAEFAVPGPVFWARSVPG
jgi:hypothetical protein